MSVLVAVVFTSPPLTGHVDLVEEVVGLRHVIKCHSKDRFLGRIKGLVLLRLAPDEQACKVHRASTNQKLQKQKTQHHY